MLVIFYIQEDSRFDNALSRVFANGVRALGDKVKIAPIESYEERGPKADVAVLVGVKGRSKACFETHVQAGKHAIIIDKGYTRMPGGELGTLYFRVSIDAFQPHAYFLKRKLPSDRWDALDMPIRPTTHREKGTVVFCGSSQKYCDWHGLGPATDYAKQVLASLGEHTSRKLIYRPKPTWKDAVRIEGYKYSGAKTKLDHELLKAFAVVTFGSNAAFESLLHGIPAVVLGDGIARSLCRHSVEEIEQPLYPVEDQVRRLAHAVAYCQWTMKEMESGAAWRHLRGVIETL